jgi:hypothetical protein
MLAEASEIEPGRNVMLDIPLHAHPPALVLVLLDPGVRTDDLRYVGLELLATLVIERVVPGPQERTNDRRNALGMIGKRLSCDVRNCLHDAHPVFGRLVTAALQPQLVQVE